MALREYLDIILIKRQIYYFTSPIEISILFISKKNKELYLYIDYRDLNKIIIKNYYLFLLINKILN